MSFTFSRTQPRIKRALTIFVINQVLLGVTFVTSTLLGTRQARTVNGTQQGGVKRAVVNLVVATNLLLAHGTKHG